MTPKEAAEACSVSERSIRGRIERGTLRVVKRGGRVHIATVDLLAAGLLPESTPESADRAEPGSPSRGQGIGQIGSGSDVVVLLGETIRALQASEAEAGRLRGLLESAEAKERQEVAATETAHAEVVELRARVQELEAQIVPAMPPDSRAWWQRMLGVAA
jgi:hypothetical protein